MAESNYMADPRIKGKINKLNHLNNSNFKVTWQRDKYVGRDEEFDLFVQLVYFFIFLMNVSLAQREA